MTTLDDFVRQTSLGQATSTAALVVALDKTRILPSTAHCSKLWRLWRAKLGYSASDIATPGANTKFR